ncbi:MAG: hypothetical protein JNK50_01085 [Bacteroidia bacterium]|nr:hypothetical protein [Bacteroidia bacterium]
MVKVTRDNNGDRKYDLSGYNPEQDRYWRFTYVFNYYDKKQKRFRPLFDLECEKQENLEKARKDKNFVEHELHKMPDAPPYDKHIQYLSWTRGLLINFFKEVFDIRAFDFGYIPENKYYRVILTKKEFNAIQNFISVNKLDKIGDLIFEIIATAQHIYFNDVFLFDNKKYEQQIRDSAKQAKIAYEILDREFDKTWLIKGKKLQPDLQKIDFIYADGKKTLTDPWLTKDILQHFKQQLEENSHFKNWKIELERFPNRYASIVKKLNFKKDLVLSLCNFFKASGVVKSKAVTSNELLLLVVKMFEFSRIPLGDEGHSESEKIKLIRNWPKRNELNEKITHANVPINRDKLLKYFEPSFIDLAKEETRADSLIVASTIGIRFGLMNLRQDFAHISQCLKENNMFISAQLSLERIKKVPDYSELAMLFKAMRANGKLKSIKFELNDGSGVQALNEPLSMYIFEQALKNHIMDNEEDFEVGIVDTKVKEVSDGNFQIQYGNKLSLPEDRFVVKFVCAFYKYLLNEAPPGEFESPSEMYFTIIALMLQKSGFFRHIRDSENFVVDKVKTWHKLGNP